VAVRNPGHVCRARPGGGGFKGLRLLGDRVGDAGQVLRDSALGEIVWSGLVLEELALALMRPSLAIVLRRGARPVVMRWSVVLRRLSAHDTPRVGSPSLSTPSLWGIGVLGYSGVMAETLIELDARRRVGLGRLGRPQHQRYLAREEPDGTIVLIPAVVMAADQAQLLANPELMTRIDQFLADPFPAAREGRLRRRN